jgi:predicted dehydrogenase
MSHDPLRIGLIGAGGISRSHLPHLLALGAEVVVFSEQGADELVAECGGRVAASLDELLDAVEIVDVATPTFTHHELVARAIRAGRHVVCEKPLARTAEQADELAALAASAGVRLFPAHVVRWFPEYVRLKQAVDAGLLGELAVLRFSRSGAYPTRTPWFADRALSGGIIMDQMIHDLDVARWVAGEVVRVSAVSTGVGDAAGGEIGAVGEGGDGADAADPIEAAHVLLTHASGAISHVAGLWGPQHLAFTTEFSVAGTLGTLEHSSAAQRDLATDLARPPGGGEALPDVDPAESPYFLELQDFVAAFRGGAEPRVTAADGAAAVRIAEAALASLHTGQPVEVGGPATPAGASRRGAVA